MEQFSFTRTDQSVNGTIKPPYFEDAEKEFAPYYSTTKTVRALKDEVVAEIAKLGGGGADFQEGYFGEKPRRYGFTVLFWMGPHRARIVVAGLPIRSETPKKVEQVRAQALANVRDWLKNAVTAQVFSPGANPLMQFLLVDGQRTLAESLMQGNTLVLPKVQTALLEPEVEIVEG